MIFKLDHEGGVKITTADNSVGGRGASRPKSVLLLLDCMMQIHDLPYASRAQDIPIPACFSSECARLQHAHPQACIWLTCISGARGKEASASSIRMA